MESSKRSVVIWLFSGCLLIFLMVIIGGITRLTGSGLSITEWKPIMGAMPPMNDHDWQIAFEKYKEIPQFQKINFDFTLEDFKSIFWWEYIHRQLGRLIGIVFIVPFIWFYSRKMLDKPTTRKVLFLFLLGAFQGFIGWFMVKSGLTERTSVSHIRLAIHLITAFITFGFTLYFALEILYGKIKPTNNSPLSRLINILFFIVTVQIVYGAFVAGLHAGRIFTTFPLMDGHFIPDALFYMTPAWLNFFDNPIMVQFIHRMLAGIIIILTLVVFFKSRRHALSSEKRAAINFFLIALCLQAVLGILTLLTAVNIPLALLHQSGAFILFSAGVYLLFLFRTDRKRSLEISDLARPNPEGVSYQ